MKILFIAIFTFSTSLTFAKEAKLYSDDGLFIQGYDPVAYITTNEAQKGKKAISYDYKSIKILFTNKQNREAFIENPEKWLPAYNGWCAYAMAKSGDLVEIEPKSFKVIKGKTYLFYNTFWADTLKKWNKGNDEEQLNNANENWAKYR